MNQQNRDTLLSLQPGQSVTICDIGVPLIDCHEPLQPPYHPGETFTLKTNFSGPCSAHQQRQDDCDRCWTWYNYTCLSVRPVERDGWGFEMEMKRA